MYSSVSRSLRIRLASRLRPKASMARMTPLTHDVGRDTAHVVLFAIFAAARGEVVDAEVGSSAILEFQDLLRFRLRVDRPFLVELAQLRILCVDFAQHGDEYSLRYLRVLGIGSHDVVLYVGWVQRIQRPTARVSVQQPWPSLVQR